MAAPRVGIDAPIDPLPFGNYLLLECVSHGRLASVHRAVLRREGRPDERFAVKRFAPLLSQDRRFAERATRVLTRAAQVEHRAHCAIAEVDRAEDTLYAALEWVPGKDLKRIAVALRDRGETMPAALVAYVGTQIAEVLAVAHGLSRAGRPAPLLHGELSPTDILIGWDGRVRLTGLGSAELAVAAQMHATRPAYHAPEIGLGAACSAQSDVFSLGACMYQVLSSKSVADSERGVRRSDSHITQIIPRALKQIVDRALASDPATRWQSAGELAHQLQIWSSTQTQPGDAAALAAFMRGLFDGAREEDEEPQVRTSPGALRAGRAAHESVRNGPWNDAAEHTPAKGVLMQQLAAEMFGEEQRELGDAEGDGAAAILEAIVNPPEPQPPIAVEGWTGDPWKEEAPASPWDSNAKQRSASARPSMREAEEEPATLRAPIAPVAPVQPVHPQPLPGAMPATHDAAPAQRPPVAMLEAWRTQRSRPWVLPSMIAVAALGVLLAGLLLFSGSSRDGTASSELTTPSTAPVPARAPVSPQPQEHVASSPTAVADTAAREREPVPPGDTVLEAEATADRRSPEEEVARPRESAPRGDVRARGQSRPEPDALGDELEETPSPVDTGRSAAALSDVGSSQGTTTAPKPRTELIAPGGALLPVRPPKPAPAAPSASSGGPTRAAIVIEQVAPRFPTRAKRMAIDQGVVTIGFTIDKSGAVKDPAVVAADPPRVFEDAALKAIRQWKYQPKLVNGVPQESRQQFTFRFK